jgi:hypothetical protein
MRASDALILYLGKSDSLDILTKSRAVMVGPDLDSPAMTEKVVSRKVRLTVLRY